MGNIGSQTSQISGNRLEVLRQPPELLRPYPKVVPPVKVLPDPESRQRLRHTNNGDILQSGGTLSGRHQVPLRNVGALYSFPLFKITSHFCIVL